ncbi:winged helix-turn-helix domain-containing protein [Azospirillum doebereinerae]|uniref:winged helix-turn-helix domain-containing protein n=1 Tax=Azospirillum doebereinerae TaxID=92933 RepID=UPI003CC83690
MARLRQLGGSAPAGQPHVRTPLTGTRSCARLNLSKQKTRPCHPQSDAKAQAAFQKKGCAKP